jgi:tetratricopeptide (TPR) repeat protein
VVPGAVEVVGLEARRSDLARGIVIARAHAPLSAEEQRALWQALEAAGVTETSSESDGDSDVDDPPRQWLAAPWLPPDDAELVVQRETFAELGARYGLAKIWCIKVETGVDGVAWDEILSANEDALGDDADDDERDGDDAPGSGAAPAGPPEVVDAVFDEAGEVLYAAPDAPPESTATGEDLAEEATSEDADGDDDGDDPTGETLALESHWRAGPPPREDTVPFPIERYPEILDDFDPDSFGIAFKLAGDALPGEEGIVNAFFALWLSVFQDERIEETEPFQRADVVHDRVHRAALMWVERLAVPATAAEQVGFLLWIVARIHEIVPIGWARFDAVDDAVKARANGEGGEDALILAGNPFADRFRRHGEEAALAWAVGQSAWSRRELGGMLVEVALQHDPDGARTAVVAERLLRRALAFDPGSDATGYLAIVMVRQRRIDEAIALARGAAQLDVRLLVIGDAAEHAPDDVPAALALLDPETGKLVVERGGAEELADLVQAVARFAPEHLAALLAHLPPDPALVPHLYNTSFAVDRASALAILRAVLALPEPPPGAGEARTALVMAWNNACIHAHALGQYKLACELADGGQRFAPENPYIYHSAACAYAATEQIDRALEQVSRAIERNYEHSEKMETDADLASLRKDPRFSHLFVEWRARRADLN